MATDDDWMVLAACRTYPNPDPIFFPPKRKGIKTDITAAKQICYNECPVRKTCLVFAVAHRQTEGVWGGLSETERRQIPRQVKQMYRETWFRLHPVNRKEVNNG